MNNPFKVIISLSLMLCSVVAVAQTRITGHVTDDGGEPLPGATVAIEGRDGAAVTDADGRFFIDARQGESLRVSYVGFQSAKVRIGTATDYNIVLHTDNALLDEVVVVGYGVQKKINVTGSVSSVDYSREAASRPISTTAQALAGASAGVNVLQSGARPGNENVSVRIRGIGTLNDASPLIIVDGFEGSLSSVNPDDIDKISVLKDAASCAIYGNRGANGVVLVTTKNPQYDNFSIQYSGLLSVSEPAHHFSTMSDNAAYMELINESADNVGVNRPYSQSIIDLWREKSKYPDEISESGYPNRVAYPNTDWMDAMYDEGRIFQRHNLSASGRTGGTAYLISLSYVDNPGIMKGMGAKKYQARANITSRLNRVVEIGTRMWGFHRTRELNDFDGASGMLSRGVPSIYPFYDGKYGWMENPEADSNSRNNLYFINRFDGETKDSHFNGSVFVDLHIPYDFKLHTSFNYARTDTEYKYYGKTCNAFSFRKNDWAYHYDNLDNIAMRETSDFAYRWTFNTDLSWHHSYGRNDITALVGFEAMYYNWHETTASKTGFINDALTELKNLKDMHDISGSRTDYSTASVYGRVTYAWASRYLFEANLRHDGSSRFARRSRWGTFPSVSAGWRLSEETFMQSLSPVLSNAKLRASWGKLGNSSIGNYEYLATYATGFDYVFGNKVSAGTVASLNNDLLGWEETASTDIGVDLGFFNNRLTIEADWYNRHTSGILYRAPIHLTVGVKDPPFQNLCEMSNRGVELTAAWHHRVGKVNYSVSANFTRNYNKVSSYRGPLEAGWITDENGFRTYYSNIGEVSTKIDAQRRTIEGRLINEYYLLTPYSGDGSHRFADGSVNPGGGPRDGMIRTEADLQWVRDMAANGNVFLPNRTIGKKGIWYGDYIYADVNGDGVYGNDNDYTFQNISKTPKYFYGLQADAQWNGFDFSMQWAGAGGFAMYWYWLGFNSTATRTDLNIPTHIAADHYFYDPDNPTDPRTNTSARYGRLTLNAGSDQNGSVPSTAWLYRADYLKLKNVTLGYSLPRNIIRHAGIQALRFFVSGENLCCITDYPGMDPEFDSATNYYSSLRQWSFGLSIKF